MIEFDRGAYSTVVLAELLAKLERRPQASQVRFNFGYFEPYDLTSYRGYYDHLALCYTGLGERAKPFPHVGALVARLKVAMAGEVFEGWKGGDYAMGPETPVWVANPGDASGTTLIGIHDDDGEFSTVLMTGYSGF
jgi:hypothetical protein